MRSLLFLLILLLFATPAAATKPCSPDSWFAKPQRPEAEWKEMAGVVFTGTVTSRDEHIAPYPNCSMDDKSQCAMQDSSVVTVKITGWEKGEVAELKEITLKPGFCANDPPKATGGTYRFYLKAADAGSYIYYAE